jgi:peroxiredoxin
MMSMDVEQVQAVEDDNTIVLQINWVQVLVILVVLVAMGGALAAGLWVGRRASRASGSPATASQPLSPVPAAQQPLVPAQPQQVGSVQAQPQPRIELKPAEGRSSAGITTSIGRMPRSGDEAPEFTLKNLEGEEVSLSDFKGQPVLVNFWATWCGPCRIEMPLMEDMYQQYKDEGFVILAVDVEESITAVRRFVDSMKLTFPILLDYKGEISNGPYQVRAFPTSYFIGRDGKVVIAHRGMMTKPMLQSYMDRVLATQPAE